MQISNYDSVDITKEVCKQLKRHHGENTAIQSLCTSVLTVSKAEENTYPSYGCEIIVVADYAIDSDPNIMRQTVVFLQV